MTADLIEKTCGKYYSKHTGKMTSCERQIFFSSTGQNVPKEPACVCTCAFSINRRAGGLGMAEQNRQGLGHTA